MERSARKRGRKKELSKQIELRWGSEELREKLNGREEEKIRKANEEATRQEEVGGDFTDNSR